MDIVKLFKNNPLEEPEILKIAEDYADDPIGMHEKVLEIAEQRAGQEVDLATVGAIIHHVLSHEENGIFKTTPKTENIEPLKPRDTLKLMRMAESNAADDELFEFIKEHTNVPDGLTEWEKTLVVKQELQYGLDALKTSLGASLGNL